MNFILLTTSTCIKCKSIKEWLPNFCEENNISLSILDALDNKGRVLVDTYNLTQVPVLFVYDELGNLVKILNGEDIYPDILRTFQ